MSNETIKKTHTFSVPLIIKLLWNARRVTGMIWKEKKRNVILLFAVSVVIAALPFLSSGALGLLINELVRVAGRDVFSSALFGVTAFFVFANILPALLYTFQNYISKVFWFFLQEKFEFLVIRKKGELDIATHENPAHQNLLKKVSEGGMWRLQNFMDRQFYLFQNIVEVIIAAAIILSFKWWVLVLVVVGTLPELVAEARYGKEIWDIFGGRAEPRRRLGELEKGFEWTSHLMEIKIFQNVPHFFKLIRALFRSLVVEQVVLEQKQLLYRLMAKGVSYIVIAFTLVWFVMEVVKGNLQVGTLTFALASVKELRASLSSLFSNLGRWYEESLFVSDVLRFLDLKPYLTPPARGIVLTADRTPKIVFENVSFTYPGTERPVLKNFSLAITPGDKIAFVGINGAGKTTIVKLLCRFYDSTEGRILIDGHDIRELDLDSWYNHVGVLFQDYPNYRFITRDVIGLGRTNEPFSFEKMKQAAKASEADVFIEEWEKKYDQMLGKYFTGGLEPSGGQWQKLALARTFYRDPRVMILDEPTSSIDAESEAKIFEKLESLPHDRTVILISHRFSTVRQADTIIVIEDGRIKEKGRHDDLLKIRKGTYARLFKLQAKGYQ